MFDIDDDEALPDSREKKLLLVRGILECRECGRVVVITHGWLGRVVERVGEWITELHLSVLACRRCGTTYPSYSSPWDKEKQCSVLYRLKDPVKFARPLDAEEISYLGWHPSHWEHWFPPTLPEPDPDPYRDVFFDTAPDPDAELEKY